MKYYIKTFGCQMNGHDSERIAAVLQNRGYLKTENAEDAGVIVINTCCVRENAENRVYGHLGHLKHIKEKNKEVKIAVCGCMAQCENAVKKISEAYKNVDLVFGTFNIDAFPKLLDECIATGKTVVEINKSRSVPERVYESVRENKYKGSVNIIYGCDNYCSYCVVPYVRGR